MFDIPLKAIVVSIAIHALWGGNPIGAKFGLEVFPPFWSAFIRFVFGSVTIWLWCRYRGQRLWPTEGEWQPLLQIGLLFTLQIALMNIGIDNTTGVNASILIATNPLFAALFAHLLLSGDRLTLLRSAGLIMAFCGVSLTLWRSDPTLATAWFGRSGDWICLASAGLLGFRLISSASAMRRVNSFRLALWQMLISLPLYATAGTLFETIHWERLGWAPVLGLLYQGVIVAGIGFMVSLWLISRYRASIMTSFNFIAPVTGVLLAAWLLHEQVSVWVGFGVTLLAMGMLMITLRRRERIRL